MEIVSRHPLLPERISVFSELPDSLIREILEKLSLRDFVRFHYECSMDWRTRVTSSKVFEGEPFFLRDSPESSPWFYAFSMQRWVQLLLPPSVQHLRPVSTSGGLVLFSGVPSIGEVQLREWGHRWPLVVVNPITRENRSLLLVLEPPPTLNDSYSDACFLECYSEVHMGLKVNADSQTYKVVVHWKDCYVMQIFDSDFNQWSTVPVPRELVTYANSSNEIVFCRNYYRQDENTSSVFDIKHGKLVDYYREGLLHAEFAANDERPWNKCTEWGYPTVGKSCLYVVSYNTYPVTFIRIHKRERSSIAWQLVAEVPLKRLCHYLEVANEEIADTFLDEGYLHIHECGKHLLFTATYCEIWCGMLYDLDKQLWIHHFIVDENRENRLVHDGLMFQPQLNGPPC